MATHVKILGMIYIVFSALGIVGGIVILALFGGIAGLLGSSGGSDALMAIPFVGGIGGILFLLLMMLSVPGLIVGIGLLELRPWARIGGIVLSALNLLHIPLGTLLGIYGLWALLNRETEQLFEQRRLARV